MDYTIRCEPITSGFDGHTCWVQARGGTIPGGGNAGGPAVVVTMQKLLLSGSDVFYALNEFRTDDLGETWQGPVEHDTLGRRHEPGGIEAVICDATPAFHAATGRLLSTGHVARYKGDALMPPPRPRQIAWTVYNQAQRTWTPWDTVALPDAEKFFSAGAGSAQRYDCADGSILLPVYFKPASDEMGVYKATVMRLSFDGSTLRYVEHGTELHVPEPRGLCEPSLTFFAGRYYLTLRNDERGYVTMGPDGLHFAEPVPWCFDDGEELGNYNTQQHWVTHSDGLFLVYTRRGANNDHVFRHRAPLFIARVDPDTLQVIRTTERVLVPERGARLGNFAVADVTRDETWVFAAEWMQPVGCEKYGSDNTVWAARITWDRPNLRVQW